MAYQQLLFRRKCDLLYWNILFLFWLLDQGFVDICVKVVSLNSISCTTVFSLQNWMIMRKIILVMIEYVWFYSACMSSWRFLNDNWWMQSVHLRSSFHVMFLNVWTRQWICFLAFLILSKWIPKPIWPLWYVVALSDWIVISLTKGNWTCNGTNTHSNKPMTDMPSCRFVFCKIWSM